MNYFFPPLFPFKNKFFDLVKFLLKTKFQVLLHNMHRRVQDNPKAVDRVDNVAAKHVALNEKLLMKVFEPCYTSQRLLLHDRGTELLRRALAKAKVCCKQTDVKKRLQQPRRKPSFSLPRKMHPRIQLLRGTTMPEKLATVPQRSEEEIEGDDDAVDISHYSTATDEANNMPQHKTPPKIAIQQHQQTPNKSFTSPHNVSTPKSFRMSYLAPGVGGIESSTPYRSKKNLESSFQFILPSPNDQSVMHKILCDQNLTNDVAIKIIEIVEDVSGKADLSNNEISVTTKHVNISPGKYEIFKVVK